ncbi:adenylate/guanylate cyclase domain-containing protein [Rhizobium beringeri]
MIDGDDLLGDRVNVAARLEQLCPPGTVLISGSAHEQLSGKLDLHFEYVGEQHLKNIARPVRTYCMDVGSLTPMLPASSRSDKPAVAVLPF